MVEEVLSHHEVAETFADVHAGEKHGIVERTDQDNNDHDSRSHTEGRDDMSLEDKRDEAVESREGGDRRRAAGKKVKKVQQPQGRYQYPTSGPSRQPNYGNNGSMPWGGHYSHSHSYGHHGNGYGHPPPPYHHQHHPGQMPQMPPYVGNHYSGPPMGGPRGMGYSTHYGSHYSNMPPNTYPSHGMPPHQYQNMQTSDSASISSKGSKGSKKRTIDGVHDNGGMVPMASSGYSIRRTDSSSSATSTVTAGNNTSSDSHLIHDSPHSKRDRSQDLPPLNMGGIGLDDHDRHRRPRNHRRDLSADASTTSSLSVGLSLASYEGPRGGMEDQIMSDHPGYKPKRMKATGGAPLIVETGLQIPTSHSDDQEHSSRFEHMSVEAKGQTSTRSDESNESSKQNLFLSLSTSPINGADVDATPISKNTTKNSQVDKSKSSIFKSKPGSDLPKLEISTSDMERPAETPTPPVHGELGDIMTDDHTTLNHHLRGQSFTPLHGLSNSEGQLLAPQLSWSIAGDNHSVGDLVDWDDDKKSDQKIRPASSTSQGSRNIALSPHDFQLWKDDNETGEHGHGATTPLPAFFESSGNAGSENHMNYDKHHKSSSHHHSHMRGGHHVHHGHIHHHHGMGKPMPPSVWSKPSDHHGSMPPTPMFTGSEYRDNSYAVRSPYGDERRDAGTFQFYPHHSAPHSTDRVRNLRGRMHPGAHHHYPPMLHIPPPMSTHLPMTSPMALPGKAGLWSPHGNMGGLASPHHLTSPLNSMTQSKRKCVPLKPPIPSKFQGDIEQVKNVPVPEFTSLVNFPVHMSQKQSVNLPEGMRCCVMCGQACPCSNGNKNKKNKKSGEAGTRTADDLMREKSNGYAIIPTQNKGLCTLCDVNVWVVCQSGLEIKWCKGCKNFRPWAAFGDKGLATKCLRCRERQREKYALQKEEKEKAKAKDKDMAKKMGIKTM